MTRPISTRLARQSRRMLSVEALEARAVPATYDLGAAVDFNAVVFTDMTAFNSDVEGRVAVGHDASFTSYGIGDRLPNSFGTRDDLIVGNDLTYTNGQVFYGNIVYGNEATLESVGIPNGDERQEADVLDFAAIQADLTATSAALGAEAPNGRTVLSRGNLNLRGSHRELDFFTLTAEQLAGAKSINVIAPAGATVVINVPGDVVSIKYLGIDIRGVDPARVLWNFYEADELTLEGIGLQGAVLAPTAAVNFNNGQIRGTAIMSSMTGNGQFNLSASDFHVEIPPPATLQGVVFVDVNGDNQRGPAFIDVGYGGATVRLTGMDSLGRRVSWTTRSVEEGIFEFAPLWPGTYTLTVTLPPRFSDSRLLGIPGTVEGVPMGTAAINQVRSIVLGVGEDGIEYMLPLAPPQD